jgi:hypothetical protein
MCAGELRQRLRDRDDAPAARGSGAIQTGTFRDDSGFGAMPPIDCRKGAAIRNAKSAELKKLFPHAALIMAFPVESLRNRCRKGAKAPDIGQRSLGKVQVLRGAQVVASAPSRMQNEAMKRTGGFRKRADGPSAPVVENAKRSQ